MTGGSGKAPQLGGARSAIVVVWLLGCIAALLYTYPLVWHVGEGIPYGAGVTREREVVGLVPGDHLQFYYFLSITDDMVRGRVPLFRDPYEFSVPEPNPRLTFFFLPFSLLFAAVAPLGGTLAYNLLVWLSFPATALSVFLLGRRLGLDVLAAILAAAGVTLLPYAKPPWHPVYVFPLQHHFSWSAIRGD